METPVTDLALARGKRQASMQEAFPRWRIWQDDAGWHAMRKGSFMQRRHRGAAAHSLHVPNAVLLAAHLAVEDALECGADWRI